MFGSKKGSLNELRRGRKNVSTSSAFAKPLRISSRAMQADPQISFHEISPPFSSSAGAMIHRLCRVKLSGGFAPIKSPSTRLCRVKPLSGFASSGSPSTRLCTDQFIRAELPDKTQRIAYVWLAITLDSTKGDFPCKKHA